jgi:hypothetical protein
MINSLTVTYCTVRGRVREQQVANSDRHKVEKDAYRITHLVQNRDIPQPRNWPMPEYPEINIEGCTCAVKKDRSCWHAGTYFFELEHLLFKQASSQTLLK